MAELQPVDFDPFAASSVENGRLNSVSVRPAGQPRLEPVDHDPFKMGVVEDVARSIPSGLAGGVSALAGLPETISRLWAAGGDKATDALANVLGLPPEWAEQTKQAVAAGRKQGAMQGLPTTEGIQQRIESVAGPLHQPQTTPGKYARNVSEMAVSAIGPGGPLRNLVNFALIPGVASEYAGQKFEGTPYEPWVRGGAVVATGGAASLLNRPRSVERVIGNHLADNVDSVAVARANQIFHEGQNRGVNLTWAEALEQAAPGAGLTNLQRVVESTRGGREVLSPVFAQRPGEVASAARNQFDQIAPAMRDPSQIGPAVGAAGEDIANTIRAAINTATQPMYDAGRQHLVPRQVHAQMMADPRFAQALDRVRNDPHLNSFVRGKSDRSVAVYDAVKKELDQTAQNAAQPLNQNASQAVASSAGTMADTARRTAIVAEQNSARGPSAYEAALANQARLREQYLAPFLNSPLGQAAGRDTTTQKAINALFPKQALANSEDEIARAMGALHRQNPQVARDLLRAYVEGVFNNAMGQLQSGANQFGGANFAKMISGQERRNLDAAIMAAGPGGARVAQGFERLFQIMEATGKRQPIGSKTAFNAQDLKDLSSGGAVANSIKAGASPSKWASIVSDAWSRWQLGGNVREIAEILIDPRSRMLLTKIANQPADSLAGQVLAARLLALGTLGYGRTDGREKK